MHTRLLQRLEEKAVVFELRAYKRDVATLKIGDAHLPLGDQRVIGGHPHASLAAGKLHRLELVTCGKHREAQGAVAVAQGLFHAHVGKIVALHLDIRIHLFEA